MEPLPFQCDQCDRGFKTNNALIAHARVHRDPPDEQQYIAERVADLYPEETQERVLKLLTPRVQPIEPVTVLIKRLLHGEGLPDLKRATPGSAAFDLYAAIDTSICLGSNERATPPVPTGISVEIPMGYCGLVMPRSGLANNSGISIINTPGLIDSDYRGEIKVGLVNHSRVKHWVHRGDRIGQLFVTQSLPVEIQYVNELTNTSRGTGGFGSTGV